MTFGAGKPFSLSCRHRQSVTALTPSFACSFGPGINSNTSGFGACGSWRSGLAATVRCGVDAEFARVLEGKALFCRHAALGAVGELFGMSLSLS